MPSINSIANSIRDLIQRLHAIGHDDSPDEDDEDPLSNLTSQRIKHNQKTALEIELQEAIQKAISSAHSEKSQVKQNLLSTIKKELALFQHGGTRGVHLQIVYDSLLTIRPTSVEAERAFSSAGYLVSKVRASLNDDTIDSLCFLRSYYQSLKI